MAFVNTLTIPQLGLGAGYALWGFRATVLKHSECPVLIRGYQHVLKDYSTSALDGMRQLVHSLGSGGRRKIYLSRAGCCGITSDELSVIALLSSAQNLDKVRRDAHLNWLMAGYGEDLARLASDAIGHSFRKAGLAIEMPSVTLSSPRGESTFRPFDVVGHA